MFLGYIQICYRQKWWYDFLRLMQYVYKFVVNKDGKESEIGLFIKEKWEVFGFRFNYV